MNSKNGIKHNMLLEPRLIDNYWIISDFLGGIQGLYGDLEFAEECDEERHAEVDDKSVENWDDDKVLATGIGEDG